jgi:hypothetical protein
VYIYTHTCVCVYIGATALVAQLVGALFYEGNLLPMCC